MRKSNFKAKKNPGHQQKQQQTRRKKPAPYQMHDKYFLMAKQQGYRARSVFKLKEIQEKFWIIQEGMDVCDIGAAPGSFIQYIKRIIGNTGNIVGIDLKPIDKYSQTNINTLVHDIFEFETLKPRIEELLKCNLTCVEAGDEAPLSSKWHVRKGVWNTTISKLDRVEGIQGWGQEDRYQFDLITSDIAPNTTWRKDIDQYASVELNIAILEFADNFLVRDGNLLLKVFKGEDFYELTQAIEKRYKSFTEFKPFACRDRSFEQYVICWNKK
jgi:23S rRNA (uridine2552-2'-O)-methyltransferase